MNDKIDSLMRDISQISLDNVFNPYLNTCNKYDCENSPIERKDILRKMLIRASNEEVETIWIGRDLGYKGGRRTGLAFTDDFTIIQHLNRWNIQLELTPKTPLVKEQTATIVWQMLNQIESNIFLWNLFPFHPYIPGDQFTNRCHNSKEKKIGLKILEQLILILSPKYLVTIGNDAYTAVSNNINDITILKVRHPSFGGKADFIEEISKIYKLPNFSDSEPQLSLDII